jgi:hypothetical protein
MPSSFVPTPTGADFGQRFPRVFNPPSPHAYQDRFLSPIQTPTAGAMQVFCEDTEPLALRRHSTKTRTKQSADKENRPYEPLVKKSSLKKSHDKKTKSDRRLRVLEPTENKLRKRASTSDAGLLSFRMWRWALMMAFLRRPSKRKGSLTLRTQADRPLVVLGTQPIYDPARMPEASREDGSPGLDSALCGLGFTQCRLRPRSFEACQCGRDGSRLCQYPQAILFFCVFAKEPQCRVLSG